MDHSIKKAFDRAAHSYDEYAVMQRHVVERLFKSIAPHITPDKTLLDAACGTGYFHEVLRKYGNRNTLWQVDIAPKMCEIAQKYAALPEFATTHTLCADIRHLPFEQERFDIIFSSLALQWLEESELQPTLTRFYHLLAPKGMLAIASLCQGTLAELAAEDASLVKTFPTEACWRQLAEHFNADVTFTPQTYWYKDVLQGLKSIKAIGASRLTQHTLRPKSYFTQLNKRYHHKHYQEGKGVPITWNIVTLTGGSL